LSEFQNLSPKDFRNRLEFASRDMRFPVVAEWRASFGLAHDSGVGDDVEALATDLGFQPNWRQRVRSIMTKDTDSHIRHILDNSPALKELYTEVSKHDFDLLLTTGYGYTCVTPDKLCRLLVVLRGTTDITDPEQYHLCGQLYSNPAVMGKTYMS
jgi:hypothetical protein